MSRSSTEQLVETLRNESIQEVLTKLTPIAQQLVAAMEDLGGRVKTKAKTKTKFRQSSATPKKSGGKIYAEPGRGRKQCPNCHMYTAAAAQDCANCGYNFVEQRVLEKPEGVEGVEGTKLENANVKGSEVDFGNSIDGETLDKTVRKILSRAKNGIVFGDAMVKICKEHDLQLPEDGKVPRSFTMRVMQSMNRVGELDKESKLWHKVAA